MRHCFVRCRLCLACLRHKARRWARRCHLEAESSPRSWFVTLTFAHVPADPRDAVQRFLKRLRKTGAVVRYMAVLEYGSRKGRAHFHLVIHCHQWLTRRKLEGEWHDGFSKAKLFEPRHAWYVSKYLTKSGARVLASQKYSSAPVDWDCAHIPLSGGKRAPKHKIPF